MDSSTGNSSHGQPVKKSNQNIQVYLRVRPLNSRERNIRSVETIEVHGPRELIVHHLPNSVNSNMTKKFTFDRAFGQNSKQCEIYQTVVGPLIEEVLSGYNCTVFAYGQTGTGKTHTMIGTECPELKSSWDDDSEIGIIPRALSHLFDELRLMEVEFSMRISYLELYNEELCDLLSTDDSTKIRIYDDSSKKGSVIIQGLEEIPVHSKDDVYKLLEKGKERRKTAQTLMNAQSSRSHTVFSILVHIKENGIDGEEMLKIGKLNLVDLAGSENVSKAGNEKGIRVRETVNINQSLLTLGRVITALVERTPHIPYRESKLTRLLQESLGGRTKTSIIATISPGHKDIEETLSTLEYAHRAKNIQNKPEVNQKLTKKTVLKEYTEEIDRLKRDLMASRDKNGIYLATETFNDMNYKLESQNKELNEKILLNKVLRDELVNKEKMFNEVSLNLVEKTEKLKRTEGDLDTMQHNLIMTKKVLNNTKRRYKEKKFLLDTHVKVEEELTTQAKEIMEVADIATKDTVDLHNTIARRKDVDIKIQSACEQFVGKMKTTLSSMDSGLDTVKSEHKIHTDLILQQIEKSNKAQSIFENNTSERISNIAKTHSSLLDELESSVKEYTTKVSSLSDEQKTFFDTFLNDLKARDVAIKEEITKGLTDLDELFKGHSKLNLEYMDNLAKEVEDAHSVYKNHSISMKDSLQNISKETTDSFMSAIQAVKSDADQRNALNVEKTEAIEAMMKAMRQMEAINTKELEFNKNLSAVTVSLETAKEKLSNDVQETVLKPLDTHTLLREQSRQRFHKGISTVQQLNEGDKIKSESKITKLGKGMVDFIAERSDLFEKTLSSVNEKNTCISNELVSCSNIIQEKKDGSNSLIEHNCQDIKEVVTSECLQLKEYHTQISAYTQTLVENLQHYSTDNATTMKDCVEQLDDFQEKELQTYTPTGETPMKKEFKYPRVLACTSPHNQIIKRLREENEWSDLDATTVCDEDSETTINYVPDHPLVVNSTPIKLKRTNSEPNCVITANNLKALKSARTSENGKVVSPSLETVLKPKKSSTPVLGGKANKENVV